MVIKLRSEHLLEIENHGKETYPRECCGLLLGRISNDEKIVIQILRAKNEREQQQQHNRFLISPRTMFDSQKIARANKMDVLGFYHSHPDVEACPSQFDLDHAWPFYAYVILSVKKGKTKKMTCWKLSKDRSIFDFEEIIRV